MSKLQRRVSKDFGKNKEKFGALVCCFCGKKLSLKVGGSLYCTKKGCEYNIE